MGGFWYAAPVAHILQSLVVYIVPAVSMHFKVDLGVAVLDEGSKVCFDHCVLLGTPGDLREFSAL